MILTRIDGRSLKGWGSTDLEFRMDEQTKDVKARLEAAETLMLFETNIEMYFTGVVQMPTSGTTFEIKEARVADAMSQTRKDVVVFWIGDEKKLVIARVLSCDFLIVHTVPIRQDVTSSEQVGKTHTVRTERKATAEEAKSVLSRRRRKNQ